MGYVFESTYNSFFVYVGVNALIMLVLALLVSRARWKTQTSMGDGGKPDMMGPLRAHANNTEYVPMGLLLMWCLVPLGASVVLLHVIGLSLTIGRVVHAIALSNGAGTSTLRAIGALLTYMAFVVGIVAVLWLVIVPQGPAI